MAVLKIKKNGIWIPVGAGEDGKQGPAGETGESGAAGTISIGTVTTGEIASVTNTGTDSEAILNFVIPKGEQGKSGLPITEDVAENNITLTPNIYYNLGAKANGEAVVCTLGEAVPNAINEYMFEITVDETDVTLTVPSDIRWNVLDQVTNTDGVLTLMAKYTYQFDIVNGLGIIVAYPNHVLATPSLTTTGSIISWESVPKADAYIISSGTYETTIAETSFDLSQWFSETGQYTIYVKAISTRYVDSAEASRTYYISETLATPTNLAVSAAGTLTWDSVPNASKYTVTCNELGKTASVTTNVCDLTTSFSLTSGTAYTFNVQAIGNNTVYLNSAISDNISYTAA